MDTTIIDMAIYCDNSCTSKKVPEPVEGLNNQISKKVPEFIER
ncbi:hypothetical protein [Halosquirtibacter laminarini]